MHGIESGCGEGLWRNCSRPKPLASHLGTQQLWLQSFLWMVVAVDAGPPQALSEVAGPALRRPRPEGLPVAEAEDAEVPVLLQQPLASPVVAQAEEAVPPALRVLLLIGLGGGRGRGAVPAAARGLGRAAVVPGRRGRGGRAGR